MGFKLRSGNGPLPFKQMGSSPAKINVGDFAKSLSTKNETDKALKITGGDPMRDLTNKVTQGPGADNIEKISGGTKTTATTKIPDKLETVKAPDYKAPKVKGVGNKLTRGLKNIGSKINQLAEKRQKFQASEEGAAFRDDMNRSANIVAGDNRFATDNLEKHKSSKRASELHKVKMDNVERDQLETDQMNEMRGKKIQAYKDAEAKKYELDETTPSHTDVNGNAVFTPQSKLRKNKPFGTDINQY